MATITHIWRLNTLTQSPRIHLAYTMTEVWNTFHSFLLLLIYIDPLILTNSDSIHFHSTFQIQGWKKIIKI